MSKRFTDTDKWQDPWFRKLPSPYQKLWLYILDMCDQAGVWKVDMELAAFMISEPTLTEEEALKHLDGRVHIFNDKKWFIPKFLDFQYGVLDESCRPHNYVLRLLKYYDLEGYLKGICTLKDKNKDKNKDKDKQEGVLGGDAGTGITGNEKRPFDEDGLVLLTQEEHKRLLVKLGDRKTADYIKKLAHYIGSLGKKYKSHYHTIMSWSSKEPTAEPKAQAKSVSSVSSVSDEVEKWKKEASSPPADFVNLAKKLASGKSA